MTYAVACLFLARVIMPGYEFLSAYRSRELFKRVREQHRPDLFARLEQAAAELGMQAPHLRDGVKAITRIVVVCQLTTARSCDDRSPSACNNWPRPARPSCRKRRSRPGRTPGQQWLCRPNW